MHPDYKRSHCWAAADNYLAIAHFYFERNPRSNHVWYLLLGWAKCMEELKEMIDADRERTTGLVPALDAEPSQDGCI